MLLSLRKVDHFCLKTTEKEEMDGGKVGRKGKKWEDVCCYMYLSQENCFRNNVRQVLLIRAQMTELSSRRARLSGSGVGTLERERTNEEG